MRSLFALTLLAMVDSKSYDWLTQTQKSDLQRVAQLAELPECEDTGNPTEIEIDYATDALVKFFPFTNAGESWLGEDLQSCLETVKDKEWLGQYSNAWEWAVGMTKEFAEHADSEKWIAAQALEYNVVNADDIIPANHSVSGPLADFKWSGHTLKLMEPCNAVSNMAYYWVGLQVCSSQGSPPNFDWRDEMIATSHFLMFGSFAMHGNRLGTGNPVFTQGLDAKAMNVAFNLYYQAAVHSLVQTSDPADLSQVLSLGGAGHEDARVPARDFFSDSCRRHHWMGCSHRRKRSCHAPLLFLNRGSASYKFACDFPQGALWICGRPCPRIHL